VHMKILETTPEKIADFYDEILKTLKNSGVVVFPSDTVYGFLADAQSRSAVEKLISIKKRPFGKPISVFIPGFEGLQRYVEVNKEQFKILKGLLPGPFTIVLPSKHKVVSLLESEKGTLGIRIPDYRPVQSLVEKFGRPITATSANMSGKGPHYTIESFLKTLSDKKKSQIDLIVDVGKLPYNKPSTVVDLTRSRISILRRGDLVLRDQDVFISESPAQTRKTARFFMKKYIAGVKDRAVFVFLQGELGVGKTEFVKGIAEALNIKDIISPTFVGFYEYEIKDHLHLRKLVHFDLYNIEDETELEYYRIEDFVEKSNLVVVEWAERISGFVEKVKDKAEVFYIKLSYEDERKRRIKISRPYQL